MWVQPVFVFVIGHNKSLVFVKYYANFVFVKFLKLVAIVEFLRFTISGCSLWFLYNFLLMSISIFTTQGKLISPNIHKSVLLWKQYKYTWKNKKLNRTALSYEIKCKVKKGSPSGAPAFNLDFTWVRVALSFVCFVVFCTSLLVLCPFSFGPCSVCLSSTEAI